MPDKTYSNHFRVDHQGGSLADLTVERLPDNTMHITSSDGQYDVTCAAHDLKYTLQQLDDKLKADVDLGLY
jgi:hypothetical protein